MRGAQAVTQVRLWLLGLAPAVGLALVTFVAGLVAPQLTGPWRQLVVDWTLLLHFGFWLGFAPPYLYACVDLLDPQIRVRTGNCGLLSLTCGLWLLSVLFYVGLAGSLLVLLP